ncbi:hypothetical protein K3N28_07425 [Glycomyces sp. TRM65418]|uniref:hypothetical protein n=1 Tax=Glycomyces sp. TRM65418 TaxID=2867006 RepID=UPI001CE5766E|nr:hypothetical protein [Glycomyces sp. TRM65418]MCC3762901.1 hypothetical protein [Glycomyces sp. TRM65418]QZD56926.1 hypothetical protein K3N28_07375 [Glycomyces sp. TRM65418]
MTLSRTFRRRRLAACSLVAALALAGCGDDSASDSDPDAGAASSDAPTAADGTDYSACDDGECEVAVSEPTDFVFTTAEGEVTLSITDVTENGIEISTAFPGAGQSTGSLGGLCESVLTSTSSSSACYGGGTLPPPEPEPGILVLQLLGMNEGAAILRMAMG